LAIFEDLLPPHRPRLLKNMKTKLVLIFGLALIGVVSFHVPVYAEDAFWNQCGNGSTIVRCETYDCPRGDTNRDGRCSLTDTDAKLQEAKNDAFCANPLSGCGEVEYFTAGSGNSCAVRVKETKNNCDLYSASNPNFATATTSPTVSPRPTTTPRASTSPTPTPTTTATPTPTASASATTKGGETLPDTGPVLWISMAIAALGVYGLFLSDRSKNA